MRKKIINYLMLNGEKKTSEKILLQNCKRLQKSSRKQFKKLMQAFFVLSASVFKIHKTTKKNLKKQNIIEVPNFINNKKARISFSIKFILNVLKSKKLKCFYKEFQKEICLRLNNVELTAEAKVKIQQKVALNKYLLLYYCW